MADETAAVREAIADNDAFAAEDSPDRVATASVTTTAFDATVTATPAATGVAFTVTVEVPTLRAAVRDGEIGPALLDGWFETLERRLEDAPKATRARVDLDEYAVESDGDRVVVTYEYTFGDARRGIGVAKTFVEYVEGTYVQGVVPGFEYDPPVAGLLSDAQQADGGPGGTPL
jgi:hypothetical protein